MRIYVQNGDNILGLKMSSYSHICTKWDIHFMAHFDQLGAYMDKMVDYFLAHFEQFPITSAHIMEKNNVHFEQFPIVSRIYG